jgi:hypothetical protein
MTTPEPQPASSAAVELPAPSQDALHELEQLLEVEAGFLARLELVGIEAIAERKEQLLGALRLVVPASADKSRIERIRNRAISNQLLTVHARDAIASIVFEATPASGVTYSPTERTMPRPGARLSVKV